MIGITPPTVKNRRPESGNHPLPLRCTDMDCPSRRICMRPNNPGETHNFNHNRGDKMFCAYLTHKEGNGKGVVLEVLRKILRRDDQGRANA